MEDVSVTPIVQRDQEACPTLRFLVLGGWRWLLRVEEVVDLCIGAVGGERIGKPPPICRCDGFDSPAGELGERM